MWMTPLVVYRINSDELIAAETHLISSPSSLSVSNLKWNGVTLRQRSIQVACYDEDLRSQLHNP